MAKQKTKNITGDIEKKTEEARLLNLAAIEREKDEPGFIETRGRKPKELSIEDIQNKAKELILDIRAYEKFKLNAGKSIARLHTAARNLEAMLRTHLID